LLFFLNLNGVSVELLYEPNDSYQNDKEYVLEREPFKSNWRLQNFRKKPRENASKQRGLARKYFKSLARNILIQRPDLAQYEDTIVLEADPSENGKLVKMYIDLDFVFLAESRSDPTGGLMYSTFGHLAQEDETSFTLSNHF